MALLRHQVCNIKTYREIQEIFNQLNHVLINAEGYCEKSKECTLSLNLFWQAMSIMHRVNDICNEFVKICNDTWLIDYNILQKQRWPSVTFSNHIQDQGAKSPPTSFPHVTSTNIRTSAPKLSDFQSQPFSHTGVKF